MASLILQILIASFLSVISKTESVNSTQSPIVQNVKEDNKIVTLLNDIKMLLNNSQSISDNSDNNSEKNDVGLLSSNSELRIKTLEDTIEQFSAKNNQNLELMLQSFSTLKMLVTVQADQFKHFLGRMETLEENVSVFKSDIASISMELLQIKKNVFDSMKIKEETTTDAMVVSSTENSIRNELPDSDTLIATNRIENLKDTFELSMGATNSSLSSLTVEIENLKRNVRNIRNDMDGVYEELTKKADKENSKAPETTGECSCHFIKTSLTRFSQEAQDQKRLTYQFQNRISEIEKYKNNTEPEKFATAMVASRLGNLERQIKVIPKIESSLSELKNMTKDLFDVKLSNGTQIIKAGR